MDKIVIFTFEDYHIAANQSEILFTVELENGYLSQWHEINMPVNIKDIQPLNNNEWATHFIYFEGCDQIVCLAVSEIEYLHDFHKDKDLYYYKNLYKEGVVGFINKKGKVIPHISPVRYLDVCLYDLTTFQKESSLHI